MGLGTLGFHRFLPSFRLTGTQKTPRPPWSSPRATGVPRTVVVGRSGSAPESRRIEKGGVRERGSLATSNHLEDESRKLSGRNSECFSFSPLWDHGICVPTPRPGLGLGPSLTTPGIRPGLQRRRPRWGFVTMADASQAQTALTDARRHGTEGALGGRCGWDGVGVLQWFNGSTAMPRKKNTPTNAQASPRYRGLLRDGRSEPFARRCEEVNGKILQVSHEAVEAGSGS